jgi:hypothetical protein
VVIRAVLIQVAAIQVAANALAPVRVRLWSALIGLLMPDAQVIPDAHDSGCV